MQARELKRLDRSLERSSWGCLIRRRVGSLRRAWCSPTRRMAAASRRGQPCGSGTSSTACACPGQPPSRSRRALESPLRCAGAFGPSAGRCSAPSRSTCSPSRRVCPPRRGRRSPGGRTKGPQRSRFASLSVWAAHGWKQGPPPARVEEGALIAWPQDAPAPTRYWLARLPKKKAALIHLSGQCPWFHTCFHPPDST